MSQVVGYNQAQAGPTLRRYVMSVIVYYIVYYIMFTSMVGSTTCWLPIRFWIRFVTPVKASLLCTYTAVVYGAVAITMSLPALCPFL